ncbi:alpha/beta hydrolase [Xanthomonas fragariae]|uniref:alpha/beta hydrolase n=1 Tax=Xanthomonas fragariae TaxID=48664 RepID=UPI000B437EB8|nr:alpha/beta hydrolase [Xanthomonas fragariae]MDM7555079.1 alpha/beta hydrolase [Xanthomonas fragariae]MDM7558177.1 alpha/beta hydrolase [Xanthomonas fragariae]MDM7575872.1 alpha/beta hydrolase [Xanthomonas fragariae]MDM7578950.1 alpha/beta hydrolase [Xanthomonas fragariae]MDM7589189.1 alpha/beta hydrolase [Xanthomonas fragariae]
MVTSPSSLAHTACVSSASAGEAVLAVPVQGAEHAPTVLLVHGSRQRRHVWEAASTALAQVRCPGLFRAILVDITPRGDTTDVERILRFTTALPDGFASLDAPADAPAAYMPHRPRKMATHLQALLRQRADTRWQWHWDLRLVDELTGQDAQIQQHALLDAASQVHCPMLLMSCGRSDPVTPTNITEFLSIAPHVHSPDATPMLAGDDNDPFTDTVLHYLDAHPSVGTIAASTITEPVTGARP